MAEEPIKQEKARPYFLLLNFVKTYKTKNTNWSVAAQCSCLLSSMTLPSLEVRTKFIHLRSSRPVYLPVRPEATTNRPRQQQVMSNGGFLPLTGKALLHSGQGLIVVITNQSARQLEVSLFGSIKKWRSLSIVSIAPFAARVGCSPIDFGF